MNAREVLHRVRDSFAAIRSIHYTFGAEYSNFKDGKPASTVQTVAEFAFEDGKFYSSFDTTPSDRPKMSARVAFDGTVHQWYDNDTLIIDSQLPEKPYTELQPVMYPFLFAMTGGGRLTFEEISSSQSWDEIGNRAKMEPSEIVNEHPCDVVSFAKQTGSSTVGEAVWNIYAARDLEYYPVRVTALGGKVYSVTDATELKVVSGARGDVVIPLKIISESRNADGHLIQSKSFAVTLKSVNVDLDDSLFSLKRFEPERTKYVDAAPKLAPDRGIGLKLVLAINACVAVLLLIAVLIKRRKWTPKASQT